jgi:hypothetical protein
MVAPTGMVVALYGHALPAGDQVKIARKRMTRVGQHLP